jgi:SAM-dependent methyltransferase
MFRLFERALFTFATMLLLAMSTAPATARATPRQAPPRIDVALQELQDWVPSLSSELAGRRVLDFGSGLGLQSVAMACRGAVEVVGVEIVERGRAAGAALAAQHGVADRVRFVPSIGAHERDRFDLCISLNSMEHFTDPLRVLQEIRGALRPGGRLLLTFSPPWFAPYGAHMAYFTPLPWVHLLFPERVVMAVRSRYRDDGAQRYEEVEGGLNRMSLARFERLVQAAGFEPVELRYSAVRGLPGVTRIPLLRELLTNRVTAVLQRPLMDPPAADPLRLQGSATRRAIA